MVLKFPKVQGPRCSRQEAHPVLARSKLRSAHAYVALAACHAEFQAIARSATALAFPRAQKEKPRQGGT